MTPRVHLRAVRRTAAVLLLAGVAFCAVRSGAARAATGGFDNGSVWAVAYAQPVAAMPVSVKPVAADRLRVAQAVELHAARNGIPAHFFHRLVRRESGYNPRAIGPRTRWGRAYGPTQILCSTAARLGERDCSRLLRDPDRAVELAAAYLIEGYNATGSWAGAAAYYHGGPNRALHGRRTRAYVVAVAYGYGGGQ